MEQYVSCSSSPRHAMTGGDLWILDTPMAILQPIHLTTERFVRMYTNSLSKNRIVMGKKRGTCLSEKEKQVRVEEEIFFDNLKNPPVLLEGVMDLLGNEHKTDELVEQRILETNKQRVNDKKEWDHLERAAMNLDLIVKKTRKRGDHLQFSYLSRNRTARI